MDPVHIWENDATRRTLADIEGAANFLLLKWPADMTDTAAHRAAQVAALDVLGGHAAASEFRHALVAAAEEAGILAAVASTPAVAERQRLTTHPRPRRR